MNLSRRSFLKSAVITGITTSGLGLIPRIVRGDEVTGQASAPEAPKGHTVILPGQGRHVPTPGLPTDFLIERKTTSDRFTLLQHILGPGVLGIPPHLHHDEDEYAYVLEGELTAQIGDDSVVANPGALVFYPRNQVHFYWNQRPTPLRFLEIISPSGFEGYYEDLAAVKFSSEDPPESEVHKTITDLGKKRNVDFYMNRVPELLLKYNLTPM